MELKMFGEVDNNKLLAEELLDLFSLEEILEQNDLDETQVIAALIDRGLIDTSVLEVTEVEEISDLA